MGGPPPSNTLHLVDIPPSSLVPPSLRTASPHPILPPQCVCPSVFLSSVPHPRASSQKYTILVHGVGAEVLADRLVRRLLLPSCRSPRVSVTASLPFATSKSPTLVQQPKVSNTANRVGAEVWDHMGVSAYGSVSGSELLFSGVGSEGGEA